MFSIPLDIEIEKFRGHLEANKRVILSAKFGDGKTTFLREFCSAELNKDFYFITLHPVNYSVAKNEDVFEYIKRDILYQLHQDGMLNGLDLDAIFDNILTWDFFAPVVSFLLSFVPGGAFYDKLIAKAKAFKDNYDERKSTWEKYDVTFTNQRGGLYEEDGYTRLIKEAVSYIQNNVDYERKVALIIEDLDRLDPAHLFRILNVIGAHLDVEADKNKFGVDNIIAVMDYSVTEKIFKHFYGEHANYEGYMSKFYSHYCYEYSIEKIAREELKKFLISKRLPEQVLSVALYQDHNMIKYTIGGFIESLSIRRVVQILTDIEEQIQRKTFNVVGLGEVILDAPILYMLAVIVRLNVRYNKQDIMESLQRYDMLLPVLGAFMYVDNAVMSGAPIICNRKVYVADNNYDAMNNLCRASFKETRSQGAVELLYNSFDRAFNFACTFVKDCTHFR